MAWASHGRNSQAIEVSRAGPYRLRQGGLIDREQVVAFVMDGRAYSGYAGDSLASALLANGVRTVARSFKFHRPRGIFASGIEEPNALVQIGKGAHTVPVCRAPTVELVQGLEARSLPGRTSLGFDPWRILDLTAPLWAAGFYNKTFIWPSWHRYETLIRGLAGLGHAPAAPDPDQYEVRNLHCDVLIVGGGSAGLKAARQAAQGGARVVLVEQDRSLGGQALWDGSTIEERSASDWLQQQIGELNRCADVTILADTTAVGYYDHNVLALWQRHPSARAAGPRESYWIARTQHLVLASGMFEQPLIFSHNDRPGIMLARAMHQYLRRYAVAPGRRVLLATNNESVYDLAADLKQAGVEVIAVADSRSTMSDCTTSEMRAAGIPLLLGWMPIGTAGFGTLRRVTLGRLTADGLGILETRTLECDAIGVSGGWSPTLPLFAQAGGALAYDATSGSLQPAGAHPAIEIVGSAAQSVPIGPRISPVGKSRHKWVDLLHDVTVADLELALRENYTSVEHVKRYTTVGMAADQGKTSTAPTLEALARLRQVEHRALGHTTMRPPFTPVTLGAIAGRSVGEHFAPRRLLPMHKSHVERGALFRDFGEWYRPIAYPRDGESREQALLREARAVRMAAGLFDGSPLGKIEVHGPDALDFVNRFYINNLKTLPPGRVRYGLMLRETGVIFDDGTVTIPSSERVLLTTTSGGAHRVGAWLEEWHQCEWPDLRVAILPVTDAWATVSLAGPRARDILAGLDTTVDLSDSAFPHLAYREGTLMGLPVRIYRVSFTGELSYEINVGPDSARYLWETLLERGVEQGLEPIGLDALLLLRLEKGYLHVGTDTDGTTVPDDVGWGRIAANKPDDYIGKRSLSLPDNLRPDRLQLVGLRPVGGHPFVVGSHLRAREAAAPSEGWITSAGVAVMTGEPLALAMVRAGRERIGSELDVFDAGQVTMQARIVNPTFYDPAGDRLNG